MRFSGPPTCLFVKVSIPGPCPFSNLETKLGDDILKEFDECFGIFSDEPSSSEQSPSMNIVVATHEDCEKTLHDLRPQYVILFDISLAAIRALEVFNSMHRGLACKVRLGVDVPTHHSQIYTISLKGSGEDLVYSAEARIESRAFTNLISARGIP